MAVPRLMRATGPPRMFSLPVVGPTGGGAGGESKTMRFDDDANDGENRRPSTSLSSSSPPEWALVELQGEVQPPAGCLPEENFTAGRLVLKPNGGVELIVGNHLLEGSFVDLKKPFAVLKKEGGRGGGSGGGSGGGGEEGSRGGIIADDDESNKQKGSAPNDSGSNASTARYKVVGIIRRKCLFKSRPRALIARLT